MIFRKLASACLWLASVTCVAAPIFVDDQIVLGADNSIDSYRTETFELSGEQYLIEFDIVSDIVDSMFGTSYLQFELFAKDSARSSTLAYVISERFRTDLNGSDYLLESDDSHGFFQDERDHAVSFLVDFANFQLDVTLNDKAFLSVALDQSKFNDDFDLADPGFGIGFGISAFAFDGDSFETNISNFTVSTNGDVTPPVDLPEPASLAILGLGILALSMFARGRRFHSVLPVQA